MAHRELNLYFIPMPINFRVPFPGLGVLSGEMGYVVPLCSLFQCTVKWNDNGNEVGLTLVAKYQINKKGKIRFNL